MNRVLSAAILLSVSAVVCSGCGGDQQTGQRETVEQQSSEPENLIRILTSKSASPEYRAAAARALGRLGADGKSALPALETARQDPDPDVSSAATEAIAEIQKAGG